MATSIAAEQTDPRKKIDEKAIAPPVVRHQRAIAFQAYVLIASAVFVTMAVLAHTIGYFPIDLTFTRAIQLIQDPTFAQVMYGISWIGFVPQVDIIGGVLILLLWATGLKWESVSALFAGVGVGIGTVIKMMVLRPRPTADLVKVFSDLHSSGFPSGHVLMATAFFGFLTFLGYTLLKKSHWRTVLLVLFALFIMLMGLSRIYLGHHWFSDVMGAYLFGSLWLALSIRFYRWGKTRYFVRQPVAPAIPTPPTPGSTPAAATS
jgi:undecaprenyl-diphosphatase